MAVEVSGIVVPPHVDHDPVELAHAGTGAHYEALVMVRAHGQSVGGITYTIKVSLSPGEIEGSLSPVIAANGNSQIDQTARSAVGANRHKPSSFPAARSRTARRLARFGGVYADHRRAQPEITRSPLSSRAG